MPTTYVVNFDKLHIEVAGPIDQGVSLNGARQILSDEIDRIERHAEAEFSRAQRARAYLSSEPHR